MSIHLEHIRYYSKVGHYALLVAAVVHALYIPTFYLLGLNTLSAVNILSVIIYLYCFHRFPEALATRDFSVIGGLVYLEVIAHAFLACYFIGPDGGFQYYIYILATFSFFGLRIPMVLNYYRVMFLVFVSVLLEVWMSQTAPQVPIDENYLLVLRSVNLSIFLLVAGTISTLYGKASVAYQDALRELAMVDELTGLNNRRSLSFAARKEISRSQRSGDALSLMVMDIDNFKEINDTYGHLCGDQILINISEIISSISRQEDTVGRWGGDEFVVLMPNTSINDLKILAERLRSQIEQKTFSCKGIKIVVTVTIGGSNLSMSDSFLELVSRADDALYKGKAAGQNCYVFAGVED
jgi:diguanylate cyclase (GGDEF)-like protein